MKTFELKCECGMIIKELSVSIIKKYRSDFIIQDGIGYRNADRLVSLFGKNSFSDTFLYEGGREYFSGGVNKIMYNCKICGEVTINENDTPNINDFIRDSEFIFFGDDIKEFSYGKLKINKF